MSDGPSQPSLEGDTGAKPSIAEVAAWLRRAAESRDGIEDLRPLRRTTPVPSPFAEPAVAPPSEPVAEEAGSEPPQDRIDDDEPPVAEPPVDEPPAVEEPLVEGRAAEEPAAAPILDGTTSEAPPADETAAEEVPAAVVVGDAVAVEPTGDEAPTEPAPTEPAPTEPAPTDEARRGEAPGDGSSLRAPADEATGAPDRSDDESPPLDRRGDGVPAEAAPPVATSFERDGSAGSRRLRSDEGERRSQVTDAPVHDAPPEVARASASAPAPALDPEPDVPVVSPAMALFASAVVKHNTSEVAVVHVTEEDLPKAEALVEDELPLAGDDAVGAGDGGVAAPVDGPDAEPAAEPEAVPDAEVEAVAEAPTGRSVASLFDLDLAELAARARGRAEERALAAPPASSDVDRLRADLDPGYLDEQAAPATRTAVEPAPVEARNEPFDTSGLDLSWDIDAYQPAEGDLREDEEEEAGTEALAAEGDQAPKAKAPAAAALAAALARRRAKRKRYPRGQLKERIGFLRRVRAMLGVVVLTLVLGVAAGAAIGAFLLFLAFAVRSAITSS